MSKQKPVSISVIRRLPRYYRFLGELLKLDIHRISSGELAKRMGLTASQIRQDLNCFGGFGQQGYGYNVELLHNEIGNIVGVNNKNKIILIGVGNLGRAIGTQMKFETRGFELIGAFDIDESLTGTQLKNLTIMHIDSLEDFCNRHHPTAAMLCIPKTSAQELSEKLVSYGIKAFWNFSHYDLTQHLPDVVVENVHLGDSLLTLSCKLHNTIE